MRIISLIVLMTFYFSATADYGSFNNQDNPVVTYIGKYKEIAQSEMERVGIPASIKLAQGILESNSGRSTLAIKANNHFGIKCGNYWEGGTFYREDDDYHNGKLIKSCFRKFKSSHHSYMAHSDFLTNPGSQYRYGFLFDLDPLDYISWAEGLKSSGYATDPQYADKLISVIEEYQLYQYDIIEPSDFAQENTVPKNNNKPAPITSTSRRPVSLKVSNIYHIVSRDETMQSIADKYNMDEGLLYFQNRLPEGAQPKLGEKIKIVGQINWGEKKPKVEKSFSHSSESYLFDNGSMTITVN